MREHHWPPDIIGGLFVDKADYMGLRYWFNDIKEVSAEIKAGMPTKKK